MTCPTCKSVGFSKSIIPNRCTFCDGSEGGKPPKKVRLTLVGLDGNAFALMGAFQNQARREGWTKEEISAVLNECKSGDYDHLLCTLMDVCEDVDEEDCDD